MKHKMIDNGADGLVCFFSNEYSENIDKDELDVEEQRARIAKMKREAGTCEPTGELRVVMADEIEKIQCVSAFSSWLFTSYVLRLLP